MKYIVTGAAGFIGSHLCERLLDLGHDVAGIDAFVPYYPRAVKEQNLSVARGNRRFTFHQLDLSVDALEPIVAEADVVVHLAAMPGLDRAAERLQERRHRCGDRLRAASRERPVDGVGEEAENESGGCRG